MVCLSVIEAIQGINLDLLLIKSQLPEVSTQQVIIWAVLLMHGGGFILNNGSDARLPSN